MLMLIKYWPLASVVVVVLACSLFHNGLSEVSDE
ncbi:hypothetical protein PMI33_00726 [Pseudomonas sp. GM67]|jgi:hypothetical protein|nr:hypothetical protein PMI33_00726 [Pseudomonas sp. GM67]